MHKLGDTLVLSASDLVGHLQCGHLTGLDLAVASGELARPAVWDPLLALLWERGARHEQGYVEYLRSLGTDITHIDAAADAEAGTALTEQAMRAGASIIVQGVFRAPGWTGRADILQRVETPSELGAWSYEVLDTKLARETKAGTVLQLCLYSALLEGVQGRCPEQAYVVSPGGYATPQVYRLADYAAYFRRVRQALRAAVDSQDRVELYPDPKPYCEVCRWQARCDQRRRADDHLSLVANISSLQRAELTERGITTLSALAAMPLPLAWRPRRGSTQAYERAREQARLQSASREQGQVAYELLDVVSGLGLTTLPAPSQGDVFFDLEGDPFVGDGGLEYLFGYVCAGPDGGWEYTVDWALSRDAERAAFERFIDFVTARLVTYPDLHIYHYAPYEPAALKRLMGRYATRETELDALLRGRRFVDLFAVVRHGVRVGVESYSIKRLEPLYGFVRELPLAEANRALTLVQAGLELGDPQAIDAATRDAVARYNRDDCASTHALRNWLEQQRTAMVNNDVEVPRPIPVDMAASAEVEAQQARVATLVAQLTAEVPAAVEERSDAQHARWVLAHCLDWHRRENKSQWWEHYRLAALSADDLLDERSGVSGLEFVGAQPLPPRARAPIHRYRFTPQETDLRRDDEVYQVGGVEFGSVSAVSVTEGWVDIKKKQVFADTHPTAVYRHKMIGTRVLADALLRFGEHVVEHGIEAEGTYVAARDLLLRQVPRVQGQPMLQGDESTLEAATRLALALQSGVLPIQGPPGAGKTHTAAQMICALVRAGKKIGVCANSHKVIRHLLDKACEAAGKQQVRLECVEKVTERTADAPGVRQLTQPTEVFAALGQGAQVVGGTAWLWAMPEAAGCIDVLFVDEAAQMSLANVLAISQAAHRLVLLGDPQQLEQPIQGTHPPGTDVSALHHVLGDSATIAPNKGLFLAETWRLAPSVCEFTSEMFYASRLQSRAGLERQRVDSASRVHGAGLRFVPVSAHGNQNASPEEADVIAGLVQELLESKSTWIDGDGESHPLTLDDILIIAPYNAQVFELNARMPAGAKIGTVDKFQGQEGAVVFYSLTTSSAADAPRGLEFLYSANRLNVATSRAKCVCVLVASPAALEVQCRTPHQLRLANAFCRYLEKATPL